MPRVVLTGATGFLGRHTLPILQRQYGLANVTGVSSRNYDLSSRSEVERLFDDLKPEVVVHFAAYSGGIGANRTYPADFYYRNTVLTAHMFDVAAKRGVDKLLYAMGGCSYPAKATSPISEDQLWEGYPQAESAGYSTAKMMGVVASKSYRSQYGLNSSVIIPGNLYGEYDNFTHDGSHVIPAMIRRYYEANANGTAEVTMWGTGIAQRDFVYAGDVAKKIPFFIEDYQSSDPVNISTGRAVSIKSLAAAVAAATGYGAAIRWDNTKPDGQLIKIFSTERLSGLGLSCETSLDEGLERTVRWFAAHYPQRTDGLRL